MKRLLKIVAGVLVVLVVFVVAAAYTVTSTDWGREQVRTRVVSAINGVAHGVVKIGRIDGDLLHGIVLHDVSITDSTGNPFVKVSELHSAYSVLPFLSRKIELSNVRFVEPEIVLDRRQGEAWNYDKIFPIDSLAPKSVKTSIQFGDWLVFKDVRIERGHLTVRLPWSPPAALKPVARDSAIRVALDSSNRSMIVRVAGGFQRVQEYRAIDAKLPLVRIAHPDYKTRFFEVDSLRSTVLAFAPPAAEVKQLKGKFELNSDSVWFAVPELQLPASQLVLSGRYTIDNGDMALHAVAKPVALADARFLYPALPTDGSATMDLALKWIGPKQQYLVRDLDLKSGTAIAKGEVGITVSDTLELHQTNVTFAGVDTRLVEQIVPALDIPRRGTLSGRVKIDGALTGMQVDGDVTFNDRRSGASRVMAVGEIGTDNGVVRTRNLRVTLTPVQVDLIRVAVEDFPIDGTISGTATLNGATNTRLTATTFDLTHVNEGELSHFTGTGAIRMGEVPYLFLDANAATLSLVTVGKFAPAAGLRGTVTGPVKLDGTLSDLSVNSLLRSADGGTIAAVGRLDVKSKEIGYSLDLTTVLFNANLLTDKAPQMSLSAILSARGRGFEPSTMQGDFDASVSTSTIDTLAVDSSRIRLRIASGIASVDTFAVRVPGASADVAGMFGLADNFSGALTYRVQIDSVGKLARYLPFDTSIVAPRPGPVAERLALARADSMRVAQRLAVARAAGVIPQATPVVVDTPPSLRRDSLAGSGLLQGTLKGSIKSFDLEGTLKAAGIVALGNTVQKVQAQYKWTSALTDNALIDLTASVDSVNAAGFQLDSVNIKGTYKKPGGDARVSVFQNSARDYAINARYAVNADRNEVRFDDLRLRFDTTQWVSTHPGAVFWGRPGVEIESLELANGKGGRIFADGKLPSEDAGNLALKIDNFEVADLMGLLQSDLAVRGMFSTDTRITGSGNAPIIAGSASVINAMYDSTAVPDVRTTFNYDQKKLVAQADATYDGRSIATAKGTVPINLATTGVTGSRLLDESSSIDIKADSLPLDLASRFIATISEVRGYAVGSAQVRGTLKEPKITGDMTVGNAEMRLNDLGVKLVAMNGAVHVKGDSVVIDSLVASSMGRIAITGGMGIAKIAEPSFDLHVTADRARVLNNEQGKVRADADITVKGPYDGVVVGGTARIREGVLQIPKADTREQISAGDPAVFAVIDTASSGFDDIIGRPSPLVNNLKMDISLTVDRDTWVRSPEANVEIFSDGDLRINIDRRRGALTLDGIVSTDRGEYEFLSKRFQLKSGAATFIGTQQINPLLQFTGEYEIKQAGQQAIKIKILIGGTLLRPRLTLASDAQPPISQSDLLSYLAFGSESGSLLQFGGSSVSGGTAGGGLVGTSAALASKQLVGVALGVGMNELEAQGSRTFGADVFNITPASVPPEFAAGNFGGFSTYLKSTQIEFGKYYSTQTFVGLNLQATTAPGFRIEHRFGNRGLSLESTLQPRFFLPDPSLAPQELKKANAFGLFLVRRWKF
ncbi:MAG: translocation/assembly module TamB domain-containing protein [Gemmatimonas sp.]